MTLAELFVLSLEQTAPTDKPILSRQIAILTPYYSLLSISQLTTAFKSSRTLVDRLSNH